MKVVVDCDPGNDDAWALIALFRAEHKCDYKVIGITCVNGNTNTHNSALNTLMVLKTLDRLDVPVFKGAESNLIISNNENVTEDTECEFHGVDGFNGIYTTDEKPSCQLIQKQHAVLAIKDFIEENPNDITILCLGPLTNIALLYKLYPGISAKISKLYIMGGNHLGRGNATRCAEFNFYIDPEAANIVFEESVCDIYVFPWEPCLPPEVAIPFVEWRMEVLAKNDNKFTKLLDPVEKKAYLNILSFWTPCDVFLACTFIVPKMIQKMERHHITVELAGKHSRGQMVIDHLHKKKKNANVIVKLDVEMFKSFLTFVCEHDSDFEF